MDHSRTLTALGTAIRKTLRELDAPTGRSQNEAARRAQVEPSYVSRILYGRQPVGYTRLRRLAVANGITEAQWQEWVTAKKADQATKDAVIEQLLVAPVGAPTSPAVPEVAGHAPSFLARARTTELRAPRSAGDARLGPRYVTADELDVRDERLIARVREMLDERLAIPYKRAA